MQAVGYWAFIIGVIIAVILGAAAGANFALGYEGWLLLLLVILGFIVGFLNIGDKEIQSFLIVAIALMVTANIYSIVLAQTEIVAVLTPILAIVGGIFSYIAMFVAPAALVVALKAVYSLGSTPATIK